MTALGSLQRSAIFIAIGLGIYLLDWAQDLLLPIVIALVLADVLRPVVVALCRWHVPNALAVTLVTVGLAAFVLGGLVLISSQVVELTAKLPDYRENIVSKVRAARASAGGSLSRLSGTWRQVSEELGAGTQPTTAEGRPARPPVRVEVVGPKTETAFLAGGAILPLVFPLSQAGIVFVVLFFLLLERDLAAHRFRWLLRNRNITIQKDTMETASDRVGRYLRMQLTVNICYGLLVWGSLWLLGLPNALLLAVMGAVLRYIPYVGPAIGLVLPTVLAIAVFPDWQRPMYVLATLLTIELITNMALEPLFYGSGTGISPLGVVLATVFWGWLWGAMGLLLAMPITVWIVIVGRFLPGLRPLAVFLSSESVAEIETETEQSDVSEEKSLPGWAD